jgi:hypothetical protein
MRSFAALLACLSALSLLACQSQNPAKGEQPTSTAPKTIELPGIDTSQLTAREKEQWSASVTELLAPCSDQAVSLAQCVTEKRKCDACVPAARFLVEQVTRGRTPSVSESAFRARFMPDEIREIELGSSPSKGASADDALVTIVEWADFECPFCGMASPQLGKAIKANQATTRLVFKHYPLPAHEHAEHAARAAVAAGMQGKFWEMHDALFKNQSALDDKGLEALAHSIGLDIDKFNADRKTEAVADVVAADRKQADKLGLNGTPMIYINGRHFDLEKFDIAEDLDAWIKLEVNLRSGRPSGSGSGASALAKSDAPGPGAGGASGESAGTQEGQAAPAQPGKEPKKTAPNERATRPVNAKGGAVQGKGAAATSPTPKPASEK